MSALPIIRYDIPAPPVRRRGRPQKYPWAELQVGGTFFAPGKTNNQIAACARHRTRRLGHQFTTEVRTEQGVKGTRVWRIA